MHRGELQAACGAVEPDHLGIGVVEVAPLGLRQVVQLVLRTAKAAGGDGVQQRLPEMGARAIDQRDPRLAGLAQRHAKLGDKFEPGRAAARDDNVMQAFDPCSHVYGPLRLNTYRKVRSLCLNMSGRSSNSARSPAAGTVA